MSAASPSLRIGVFDSGLGGLTVLKALRRELPRADFHYVGDTARVPYGTKSDATIRRYALEVAHYLGRERLDALVVACNTVSAVALPDLQAQFGFPVIGMVDAGAQAAAESPRGAGPARIGVICTAATARSGAYERALEARLPGALVRVKACPLFVPLVEEGWTDGPVVQGVIERYLAGIKREGVDTLLLGCTHYPLLKEALRHYFAGGVAIASSGRAAAAQLRDRLKLPTAEPGAPSGTVKIDLTDPPAATTPALLERFLGEPAPEPAHLDAEKEFRIP